MEVLEIVSTSVRVRHVGVAACDVQACAVCSRLLRARALRWGRVRQVQAQVAGLEETVARARAAEAAATHRATQADAQAAAAMATASAHGTDDAASIAVRGCIRVCSMGVWGYGGMWYACVCVVFMCV